MTIDSFGNNVVGHLVMERRICRKADNNPEIPRKIYRGKRERRRTILPCDPTKSHAPWSSTVKTMCLLSQWKPSLFSCRFLITLPNSQHKLTLFTDAFNVNDISNINHKSIRHSLGFPLFFLGFYPIEHKLPHNVILFGV